MQLFFESNLNIGAMEGKMRWVQGRAEILPEPVIPADRYVDGAGISVTTVLKDGGCYRMWYWGIPEDWGGEDVGYACYAESDNGLDWTKPALGQVDIGHGPNNVTHLGAIAFDVFIDPDSPPSHRYRGTTYIDPGRESHQIGAAHCGYYTAHSPDGLHWELDGANPAWWDSDVISAIYHPGQRRGLVALKRNPRYHGIPRRAVWNAELVNGQWSDCWRALVPDDFDDVCAIARGYASGDYYGLSMQPAGMATAGFLQQFRHSLPRSPFENWENGVFGVTDISLVYQESPRACWQHAPGRRDFLTCQPGTFYQGGIYPASGVVEVGDEHWLYFAGQGQTHGWYINNRWTLQPRWKEAMRAEGTVAQTGVARWPKWRLFGYTADPEGTLTLNLGEIPEDCILLLNYECDLAGSIRVELPGADGHALDDAVPLTGSHLAAPAAWKGETRIPARPGRQTTVKLHLERATVWAYEVEGME
ncbi:MAG: hypothetical protein BWY76_00252 [bacterium ADurb.Bin429]|nr:MAG: hypothetical protein BWY76_00252 [bacterium ADurb.Bin429]